MAIFRHDCTHASPLMPHDSEMDLDLTEDLAAGDPVNATHHRLLRLLVEQVVAEDAEAQGAVLAELQRDVVAEAGVEQRVAGEGRFREVREAGADALPVARRAGGALPGHPHCAAEAVGPTSVC